MGSRWRCSKLNISNKNKDDGKTLLERTIIYILLYSVSLESVEHDINVGMLMFNFFFVELRIIDPLVVILQNFRL